MGSMILNLIWEKGFNDEDRHRFFQKNEIGKEALPIMRSGIDDHGANGQRPRPQTC